MKLDRIKGRLRRWFAPPAARRTNPARLMELACGILTTRPDEIDCRECFERLDQFAEMVIAGGSPSGALPLVQDHLGRCPDCWQEYLALMAALRADSASVQVSVWST